jgi:PAS domain S-box-containing protein
MTDDAQRFADFARITGDWYWETGVDGRFTYFSVDVARNGLDLNPRIGRSRRDQAMKSPENLARLDALDALIAERKPFRDVVYRALADGEPRWVAISGEARLDDKGAFAGYRGVGRDVTALVEARAEIEKKSRALEAILRAMPDGVQLVDAERRIVAINDRLYEIMDLENRGANPPDGAWMASLLEVAKRGEYGAGDPERLARERAEATLKMAAEGQSATYERQLASGRWVEARFRTVDGGAFLTLYRDITEAKEHAAEVERHSALLRSIFDKFPGGIAIYDKDRRLAAFNAPYADIIGADPADVKVGVTDHDVLLSQARRGEFGSDEPPEAAAARRLKALRAGRLDFVERVRPNGRAFEMRRAMLPDGGSVSIYLDTTERTKAARELQELNATLEKRIAERTTELAETERFQRALIASVPGMVYRCRNDRDWTIEFASPGSIGILGVRPEDLMDGTVTYNSLIHPHEQEAVWRKVQADFAQGDAFEHEYRVRGPDGGWRWVWDRARAIRNDKDEVVKIEGLVLDVDARRRAEQAARAARDNLMDAIDALDHNMLLYDRNDRLVLYTRHLLDQYPTGDKHFRPGRTFAEIFRDIVEHGLAPIPAGMTKEQFIADRIDHHWRADGAVIVRHLPDGRVLHISEHRSQSGGIVSIGRDVTRQLKIETQLREAQRMDAIGQLTGGLAHDLNNYLAVVIGNLDLLSDHDHGDPDVKALIEGAMGGAQRGAELTRSLLAFSRRQPLDPKVLDIGQRVADVARLLERTIGEKIEVELAVAPDLWRVRIDGAQLDSSIVNLANNARDAMPHGGRLSIKLRNAQPAVDDDGPPGAHVLLDVSDTGKGMSADTLEKAFEPFFTTKGPGHGAGLGLSMVHGFVHQSGGVIRMASVPGEGTTVRIFLPRSEEPKTAEGRRRPGALPRGSEHILLVEDNEYVRMTAVDQLTSLGYRVTQAETGDAALQLLEENAARFKLVFSDIVMPGRIDGYELAKLMLARWPGCKVLLSSGFSGELAGATDGADLGLTVLRKPYRKAELARVMREVLDS